MNGFKLLFKWKQIKKAIFEVKEAYVYVNDFLNVAQDTINDKELLAKLRKAKIEVIEAKHALEQLIK